MKKYFFFYDLCVKSELMMNMWPECYDIIKYKHQWCFCIQHQFTRKERGQCDWECFSFKYKFNLDFSFCFFYLLIVEFIKNVWSECKLTLMVILWKWWKSLHYTHIRMFSFSLFLDNFSPCHRGGAATPQVRFISYSSNL